MKTAERWTKSWTATHWRKTKMKPMIFVVRTWSPVSEFHSKSKHDISFRRSFSDQYFSTTRLSQPNESLVHRQRTDCSVWILQVKLEINYWKDSILFLQLGRSRHFSFNISKNDQSKWYRTIEETHVKTSNSQWRISWSKISFFFHSKRSFFLSGQFSWKMIIHICFMAMFVFVEN